jgi:nicotinic acid mononucleotide adenylyltransferase
MKKPKKEKSGHNPEKYIELEPRDDVNASIKEAAGKTAVITFGRFNPPQIGHEKLVNKLISIAAKERGTPLVYLSHTQDKKKNPLSYQDKLSFAQIAFGSVVKQSQAKTIMQVAKELQSKFDKLIVVVGQDRVSEFETLLNKYNGSEYKFDEIKIVSAGARDPDADDITGMSASKMRVLAMVGNFEQFKSGLPNKLKASAEQVYKSVREGMGIMEDYTEEELDEARQPLTIGQRRRRAMTMRRYRSKIKMARERMKRRMAPPEKLKLRAQRKARGIIRDRLMKSKKYSEMSPAEKIALDKRLLRVSPAVIQRIARRQLPVVRKAEVQRLSDMNKAKTEDFNLNMMFEQFVNEPDAPRRKKFRYLFTREGKVNCDQRFKMFKPKTWVTEDLETELFSLMEAVEALDKTSPLNREHGTDSLVKILKSDTPGEEVKEGANYYRGLAKSTSAKRKAHFKKGAAMDDDNPAAYKPAPGDARAKTKPSIHTKRYKDMFGEDLSENIKTGIQKKSEETGISYDILKQVFDRGVAAWRTGHRPGTTPAQWGMARINSFATGGKTRTTTDADLWAKHKGK